jgi:putative pyruvate formate lyase activating enzyme
VSETGLLEVVDPDWQSLELMREIDTAIVVPPSANPQTPGQLPLTRAIGVPLEKSKLVQTPSTILWQLHDQALAARSDIKVGRCTSLMDVKVELARRELRTCHLCGHGCGVNRLAGERGRCGLGTEARVAECFVHVGEENEISPALVFNLRGCALRCRYCQQHPLLSPIGSGELLEAGLWSKLEMNHARSLEFAGGNPDESVFAVLRFLSAAPADFSLPIVWNCHGYGKPVVYRLLRGVVDVYVPDFKYFSSECASKLSGIDGYTETVCESIRSMIPQRATVIVRMLVLPGHVHCCHFPALAWLAGYRKHIVLHALSQYAPDYRITEKDGSMALRASPDEVAAVVRQAEQLGFRRA